MALWPVLGAALVPVYGAFLAAVAAAALGRIRGPLAAAWAAAGTLLFLLLTRTAESPFTGYQGRSRFAADLSSAGNPFAVFARVIREIGSPPMLLQVAVWVMLAALVPYLFGLRSLEHRLWAWALTLSSIWVLYRVVPVTIWHHHAPFTTLLLSVCVAAVVIGLPVVLGTGRFPEEHDDERPEVD